jgi:hypothetical protein
MDTLTTRRETLALGMRAALAVGSPFAAWGFQKRDRSKSMAGTTPAEGLSPDLIPFISKPDVIMAVVSVAGVRWARQTDQDLEVDTGPVTFRIVRVLHGTLRDGQSIEVLARRVVDFSARVRHNFDAWNTLSLTPGEHLILAVHPGGSSTAWVGDAAKDVPSVDAPDVQAVRRAYAIEDAAGDVAAKAGMLNAALRSGEHLLVFYAIDYLRRHAHEREESARVLASVAVSPLSSELRLEIGRALAGAEFFQRPGKDDSVNGLVVASLATALVQETDGARRASWAQLLMSCVLMDFVGDETENRKIRLALSHAPGAPNAARVIAAISSSEPFAAPDMRPKLQELAKVWQTT